MIGVALVGFITILASSTKASIDASIDKTFTGDFVVDSGTFDTGGLSPTLATELATLPQVDAVTGLRMVAAEVDGSSEMLLGADPATLSKIIDVGVTEGSIADLGATEIGVLDDTATDKGLALGDTVPVRFAETGVQQLTVAAIYSESDLAGDWFLGLPAVEANVADQFDMQVLVTIAAGVTPDDARVAITEVADAYPQAEVQDRTEFKEAQSGQIDVILNLIYALLGLAVLIALLGIANTLALSIFERTRELGLLRAVGMTRRQLRTTVRWEAVIIALLGTTLGLAIGTAFGWALVQALSSEGLSTFTVPAGQMALVAVVAAVAGVAAAILPARRASKLNVLQAITAD
jgi:putative ABC transport system permease protein